MIKNKKELTTSAAKKYALELLTAGINAVMPQTIIKNQISLKNSILKIKDKKFNLKKHKRIFVVGFGKASSDMAQALEKVLKNKITNGIVIATKPLKLKKIRLVKGNHPVPSQANINGAKQILKLVSNLNKDDLVICLISGGGSAIFTLPAENITLNQIQKMTDLLLKSGATINEINIVRKHMSQVKGGQLAKKVKKATLISLILSDVIGDNLDIIASAPTVADKSTFQDAMKILNKYKLIHKAPKRISNHIMDGVCKKVEETPSKLPKTIHNILIGNNQSALEGIAKKAKQLKLKPIIVTSKLVGEARDVGRSIAKKLKKLKPKQVLIYGGETTVTVKGKGLGGRNQEVILSAVEDIKDLKNTAFASVCTDGIDYYKAAGAVIDEKSHLICKRLKLECEKYLANNDAFPVLKKIKALIFTGYTGTNVCDIIVGLRL
ncbi:DUF4147 domain-containing protein [Candidatus Woesearchaeota archaeon]|nr:DUF4147 domain-containing protein [Candidatus Woesearchaeota archaeon]